MTKRALITGITGQDGAYLAEFLLAKGYEVHGVKRRASLLNTRRIDHLYQDPHDLDRRLFLYHGDLTDAMNLIQILKQVQPDEIYHLGAQSHVQVSFETPEYTANVDALGTLRLLESLRILGLDRHARFYQASTSELYGQASISPQNESTPFHPRSPYAVAKLYAHWIVVNYREAYGMYACNGILFNHESPMRGETFVSRKITQGLARIRLGQQERLYLGNLNARRDWGHARDYVEAQWLMLQQDIPEDFVIATGIQHSVRDFIALAARDIGITLEWIGSGTDERGVIVEVEKGITLQPGQQIVAVDERYYRPAEVDSLCGDATKARLKLRWQPQISFEELVSEMARHDLRLVQRDALVAAGGFNAYGAQG